jgi:hypothetical protein
MHPTHYVTCYVARMEEIRKWINNFCGKLVGKSLLKIHVKRCDDSFIM